VPAGGQPPRVRERRRRHRVQKVEELPIRAGPHPPRHAELEVGVPRSLEGAQQVGMVRVGLDRMRAVVKDDEPRPGVPRAARQARVVPHLLGAGRGAVEEHAINLVPVEVPAQVSDRVADGTLPVVRVDVPAHRDPGGAQLFQRGKARPVQLAAWPVRQVEDDQPDPRRVPRQPLPLMRVRGGVKVRRHDQQRPGQRGVGGGVLGHRELRWRPHPSGRRGSRHRPGHESVLEFNSSPYPVYLPILCSHVPVPA
jgi:hypothetical protein